MLCSFSVRTDFPVVRLCPTKVLAQEAQFLMLPSWSHLGGAVRPPPGRFVLYPRHELRPSRFARGVAFSVVRSWGAAVRMKLFRDFLGDCKDHGEAYVTLFVCVPVCKEHRRKTKSLYFRLLRWWSIGAPHICIMPLRVCQHTYTHTGINTSLHPCIHQCVHAYMHTSKLIYTHTCTCLCMYVYIYV